MDSTAKEGSGGTTLKKRHLGLIGLLTVALQYGVGVKNDHTTADSLQKIVAAQLQAQQSEMRAERERDFVRKVDLDQTLRRLDHKLEKIVDTQETMNSKVSSIEGYLKHHQRWSANLEPGPEVSHR